MITNRDIGKKAFLHLDTMEGVRWVNTGVRIAGVPDEEGLVLVKLKDGDTCNVPAEFVRAWNNGH
jgi:hypothetical protein